MTGSVLHIVFNMSGAGSLRKALSMLGRRDRVIALCDDLSFGPIDPPDPALRAQWVERELGYENWSELDAEIEEFWNTALSGQGRHIAWTSRRSAQEYAGFLEFVWRFGNAPCDMVDLTEITIVADYLNLPMRKAAVGLGSIAPDQIIEEKLLEQSRPLDAQMREIYLETWKILRDENAALRVLHDDLTLLSAPISFFDERLLAYAKPHWLKSARIVAQVLMEAWDRKHDVSDLLLASRLCVLVAAGRLESQGDLSRLTHSEVRLPTQNQREIAQ